MGTETRQSPRLRFDLRRERLNAGLSYTALAEATGVHRETLMILEDPEDDTQHRAATLKKIADYFGVTVIDVIDGLELRDAA